MGCCVWKENCKKHLFLLPTFISFWRGIWRGLNSPKMGMKRQNVAKRGSAVNLYAALVVRNWFHCRLLRMCLHVPPSSHWGSPAHTIILRISKTKMDYCMNKTIPKPILLLQRAFQTFLPPASGCLESIWCLLPCNLHPGFGLIGMKPRLLQADSDAGARLPLTRSRMTAAPPESHLGPRWNKYASSRQWSWVNQRWQ